MLSFCSNKYKILLILSFIAILFPNQLLAGSGNPDDISWLFLIIGLLGGLALFLYGIEKMSEGMKKSAGNHMRSLLAALTKNRLIALFAGAFVTMVIQSSSATTVMLVSFVQAGLMSFVQTLGVILGADIGTTVTAQLIAFKLTDYALLMVAIGFAMRMFGQSTDTRNAGEIILGFGILFYGMKLMSDSMRPLRDFQAVIDLMKGLEHPLPGILAGMLFTAIIQSSSAFTGVVIVMAQQGLITLDAGIPLIFGGNIGTCVTAGLASIGTSREAKRVACAHVIFKVAGVLLFIFWIPEFADLIRNLAVRFESGIARQIANAHTIFNVGIGLVFLPFTGFFATLILKIIPVKEERRDQFKMVTLHLDESCLSTPALAIDLARAEISRMAKLIHRMMRAIIIPFMSDEQWIDKEKVGPVEAELLVQEIPRKDEFFPKLSLMEGIDMREEKIDFLEEKIKDYLIRVSRRELSDDQTVEIYGMMSIIADLESVSDIIHRNMVPLVAKKEALDKDFSLEGKEELMIYHEKVCSQIRLLEQAFAEMDLIKAKQIMETERIYLDLELQYRVKHLERILHEHEEAIKTHEVHVELMDLMKQIVVYSSNIAKIFHDACVPGK